jgi:ribosomal protein S27E
MKCKKCKRTIDIFFDSSTPLGKCHLCEDD